MDLYEVSVSFFISFFALRIEFIQMVKIGYECVMFNEPLSRVHVSVRYVQVSDGLIAPDFDAEALEMLKGKKGGKYVVLKMDPEYEPKETSEVR